MKKLHCYFALVFLSSFFVRTTLAEIVVIVNPKNNAADSITPELIGNYFLGKKMEFKNGMKAIALDFYNEKEEEIRHNFYNKILNKSPYQIKAYWTRLAFTGKGKPPRGVNSQIEVRKMVAEDTRFIGYIDIANVDDSVKIIHHVK